MTTFLLSISAILLISGILAIFGAFGYAMFNMYRAIGRIESGDFDIRVTYTSIIKTTIASIAAIIFGGAISLFGWVMAVIVMSFAVVTP